jgi:hypothetical protein
MTRSRHEQSSLLAEPPKEGSERHLVEHKNGEVLAWHLYSNGQWGEFDNARMKKNGYLGVRTPFDEEAERVEFEAWFKGCDFSRDKDDQSLYANLCIQELFDTWLAAKRHERGIN